MSKKQELTVTLKQVRDASPCAPEYRLALADYRKEYGLQKGAKVDKYKEIPLTTIMRSENGIWRVWWVLHRVLFTLCIDTQRTPQEQRILDFVGGLNFHSSYKELNKKDLRKLTNILNGTSRI